MFENLEANEISAKICYPSSFMICESSKRGITEECRIIPHSELEMAIATTELYLNIKSYNSKYRLITYIHRFGEIYGDEIGCHNLPGLVNQYWKNARQMEAIKMHGMGLQSRTLTHITDACRNSIQCMNLDFSPRIINIAGEKMSIADFTMLISLHFNAETTFTSPEEQNIYCNSYAGDQHLSSSLIKTLIVCKSQYTFRKWLKSQPQIVEHSA